MKRFFTFPFALGICGALFYFFCWIQFALVVTLAVNSAVSATNPRRSALQDLFVEQLYPTLLSSYPTGLTIGIVAGLVLATWDKVRNNLGGEKLSLTENVLWCLFYALLFSIPNHIVGILYLYGYTSAKIWGILPLLSLFLLNFTAILWAAIRSITNDDVLTPRVLRDKLRERSRLN